MIIDCISDLHGYLPKLLGGDLLIVAGDITNNDSLKSWAEFFLWLKSQNYRKKILISGNHDRFLENGFPKCQSEANDMAELQSFLHDMGEMEVSDFEYLCDSGTTFDGIKIWGSPWTNWFHGINPKCKAFNRSSSKLSGKWYKIPDGTDILVTHGPPFGILDTTGTNGESVGNVELLDEVTKRVGPKLHVFGHIHENGGKTMDVGSTTFINASIMNEVYDPVNEPVRINI